MLTEPERHWNCCGDTALRAPHAARWLSDSAPRYTATASVYAHKLGLVPITTPAYSPQDNGLAEAFGKTLKRDYVAGAELRDAESVLAVLSGWIEDYNTGPTRRSRCGALPTTGRHAL